MPTRGKKIRKQEYIKEKKKKMNAILQLYDTRIQFYKYDLL